MDAGGRGLVGALLGVGAIDLERALLRVGTRGVGGAAGGDRRESVALVARAVESRPDLGRSVETRRSAGLARDQERSPVETRCYKRVTSTCAWAGCPWSSPWAGG